MEIIYVDSLFFLNLAADYLLLLAAAAIAGLRFRRGAYLLAALLGAVYSVAVYLPGCRFLAAEHWRIGAGLGMGLIAFGGERKPWRCMLSWLAVSAAFGGALWALGGEHMSLRTLMLCFGLCYGAMRLYFSGKGRRIDKQRKEVRLRFLGREAVFPAMVDSGNELHDPVTGARVLVACPHALRPILREYTQLFETGDAPDLLTRCAAIPMLRGKLRLLPFYAVGGGGLLPVFRPDALLLDGERIEGVLIGVSPQAAGDGYEGIVGVDMGKEN